MLPRVSLLPVSRDDVRRIAQWLADPEVNASWYGSDDAGNPIHIAYSPKAMLQALPEERNRVFSTPGRLIFSIYTDENDHIGEAQAELEEPLRNAQLFVLIGRKDLWNQHYGTAAMLAMLDLVFNIHGLHRAWVDVPEYNIPALRMCEHIGFVLEGRLRRTRLKDGKWYDSIVMGLLVDEYARRKARGFQERPT